MTTKIFSKSLLLLSLFSIFFFSTLQPSFALDLSKPLAGDSRGCGDGRVIGKDAQGNPIYNVCSIVGPTGLFAELKDVFLYAVIIIAFFALISFVILGVKGLLVQDQAGQMKELRKQGGNALVTLLIVVFFGSIVIAVGSALIKSEYLTPIKQFFSGSAQSLLGIQTAYAQGASTPCNGHLCNALVVDSAYDVGVIIYQLTMRWVLIPVLIGSWIWAGFLLVSAQGNPEKIKYAKSRLYYSVIWTVVLMLVLGLAFAFRDTFNQIFT